MTKSKSVRILNPRQVAIEGGRVFASSGYTATKPKLARVRIVDDFAALESEEDVAYFVNLYGPVKPSHVRQKESDGRTSEGFDEILKLASIVRSIRTAHKSLAENKLPKPEVLAAFFDRAPEPSKDKSSKAERMRAIRFMTGIELQKLVGECRLRPAFEWDATQRRWIVNWTDLPLAPLMPSSFSCALSAVVSFLAQDMTALAHETEPDAVCVLCGRDFAGRTQQGRASYCQECRGTPAMWRHIKRRQRAKA